MRHLRFMVLFAQLARLLFLDTGPGDGGAGDGGAGGSGGDGGGSAGGGSGEGGTGSTGGGSGGTSTGGNAPKITGEFDQEKATRLAENLRADVKKEKDKRTATETQLAAVLKALGLTPDGKTDPEKLTADLQAEQARARQATVDLAVYKAATKPEIAGNPTAILDSRSFSETVSKLDPASSTFEADVEKAVAALVKASPNVYGAGEPKKAPPARSGGDFSGGTQTDQDPQPKTARDRLRNAYAASAAAQTGTT